MVAAEAEVGWPTASWLRRTLSGLPEQRCLQRCLGLPAKAFTAVEGAPHEGADFGGRGDVAMGRAALPSPAGGGDGTGEHVSKCFCKTRSVMPFYLRCIVLLACDTLPAYVLTYY